MSSYYSDDSGNEQRSDGQESTAPPPSPEIELVPQSMPIPTSPTQAQYEMSEHVDDYLPVIALRSQYRSSILLGKRKRQHPRQCYICETEGS